jgi:hypothetical protein
VFYVKCCIAYRGFFSCRVSRQADEPVLPPDGDGYREASRAVSPSRRQQSSAFRRRRTQAAAPLLCLLQKSKALIASDRGRAPPGVVTIRHKIYYLYPYSIREFCPRKKKYLYLYPQYSFVSDPFSSQGQS